jgi:hypothetical protein
MNFDSHGTRRSGGSWGWYEVLVPWTSEVEAHLARIRLVNSVLFYLDRSIVDREAVEALSDAELKAIPAGIEVVEVNHARCRFAELEELVLHLIGERALSAAGSTINQQDWHWLAVVDKRE